MSIFQHISRVTAIGAVIVLFAPSFAAAEQGPEAFAASTQDADAPA